MLFPILCDLQGLGWNAGESVYGTGLLVPSLSEGHGQRQETETYPASIGHWELKIL